MDEYRARSQHVSDNDRRVLVIVKRPLLALRYTLPDGRIRKTQMNFVPSSGCDVALETFRAAGLPIRDKGLSEVQSQRPQSFQSQPRSSQEQPRALDAGRAARPQSSQSAFPGSSQSLSQGRIELWDTGYGSIPPSAQPKKLDLRPTSSSDGVNQDDFSRPISASSRSTLDAFGSTRTVITAPVVAEQRTQLGLLPSPVFNGTYGPFGSSQVRPVNAPEQTQTKEDYTKSPPLSQMLPPERILPFPEKKMHPFRKDEAASQEDISQENPAATKTKAKRQTKPRAQPAKPRKSRATNRRAVSSRDELALSSAPPKSRTKGNAPSTRAPPKARATAKAPLPGAPPSVPFPELQAIPPSSEPPALPSINARKRSLNDQLVNQPNKRHAQTTIETMTETMTEMLTTAVAEQAPQAQPPQAADPLIDNPNHDLLDSIDNFMRKYHGLPALKVPLQTAEEHLAEYAAQSDEDRISAFDNMVCECMQDENFAKLMEDVEGAWKGIGLGL